MAYNDKTLTIAIPTYNRFDQIAKQVRILLPQLSQEVKLLVIDNYSSTPIEALFSTEELNQFKIIRNNSNRGILGNWLTCFDQCETPWLWTASDDDQFVPNVVEIILNSIKKNLDSIFININTSNSICVTGFEEYCKELRNMSAYTDSFWMTKCIFNFGILQKSNYYNHFYTTTMISPAVMVLRHLELNPTAKVTLDSTNIITGYVLENTWLKTDLIKYSTITCEIFDVKYHSFLRKTLFHSQFKLSLRMMNEQIEKGLGWNNSRYILRLLGARFGHFRMLYNFPKEIFIIYTKLILPATVISFLRNIK